MADTLDIFRESLGTHFRAKTSVDRAVVHHLDSKLEQMSSSGEDFGSDEEEGGFTQIGLEMELDARKPSVPQLSIVRKSLPAFKQQPQLYKAKPAAAGATQDMIGQVMKPQADSNQADLLKLLEVARAKPVNLPTYDGKSKAAYAGFKDSFRCIIEHTSVPQELWGVQLENSLIGDALEYIGGRGLWHGRYEELWII